MWWRLGYKLGCTIGCTLGQLPDSTWPPFPTDLTPIPPSEAICGISNAGGRWLDYSNYQIINGRIIIEDKIGDE